MSLKNKINKVIDKANHEDKSSEFIAVAILMMLEEEGLSLMSNGWFEYDEIESLYEEVNEFIADCE